MRAAFDRIVDPLLSAIRRELSAIISRLHRVDFGNKSVSDPMTIGGGMSSYMKDLIEKLDFVRTGILGRYNVAELTREWYAIDILLSLPNKIVTMCRSMSLVKHVVRSFVVHASIACPLSESGKLQLTSDMTELEFALSAFMVLEDGSASKSKNRNSIVRGAAAKLDLIGADYRALRGLRCVPSASLVRLSSLMD
jgi:conserved oligomeric Golgi complex subunit 5